MVQKYLLLKGCAGLGNRIYSALNALDYCIANNRKLVVDWSDGQFGEKGDNIFNDCFTINDEHFYDGPMEKIYNIEDCNPTNWKNKLSSSIYDLYQVGSPSLIVKKLNVNFLYTVFSYALLTGFDFDFGSILAVKKDFGFGQ